MPLSVKEIRFIEENFAGKTKKEIRDMVGIFYKQHIKKSIKFMREPKCIKEILRRKENLWRSK